jgi:hypothetical protein
MTTEAVWLVTWSPMKSYATVRDKWVPLRQEHHKFDDQNNAVRFVMEGLADRVRESAALELPGGRIVGLPVISQMYAAQERNLGPAAIWA